MNKKEIQEKVNEFSEVEDWNHYYEFPYNIKTLKKLPDSPGNNLNKWNRLKQVLKTIGIKNKSIIDIGCSDGYYSNKCAKLGAKNVLGIDLDDLRIQRAKFSSEILKLENVEFKNLDIYGTDLDDESFNVVLALGILHRVSDMYGFLKRISELGDTMVLEFKTFNSKDSVCRWGGAKTKGNEFNNLFFLPSIKFVSDILESLNFNVVEVKKDNSKLKFKRTIIVAKLKKTIKNTVFDEYKDKHKNERVFLIGNGPSLAETDLNLLKNENTIAMNRISMIYGANNDWRPTYYLFSSTNVKDENWGKEWLSSVHSAISEPLTKAFIASVFKPYIDPNDKFNQVKWFDSLSETRPNYMGEITKESFSTNIVDKIDKTGTTMNLALQLSYHMGFSEIVFVGADLGWTKDLGSKHDPNHFDSNYRANISNPYKANSQMRNVHKLALSIFKKNKPDVKIYNASVKTVLDTYPIIKFKDYVKDNKIVNRKKDSKAASEFWENQIYIPPKSVNLIIKFFKKLKQILRTGF